MTITFVRTDDPQTAAPAAAAPHPLPGHHPARPVAPRSLSAADSLYVPRHGSGKGRIATAIPSRVRADAPSGPLARALAHAVRHAVGSVLAAGPVDADAPAPVRLTSAVAGGPLVVSDDGVGLSPAEVRGLLAASVSGGELGADPMSPGIARLLRDLFRVADVVEIRSRSAAHTEAATVRAVVRSDGSVRLSMAGAPLPRHGTELRIHVREALRPAVGDAVLPAFVAGLTDDLPVPVTVDGAPVRTAAPVWGRDDAGREAWVRERLGVDAIAVLPLDLGPSGARAIAVVLGPGVEPVGPSLTVFSGGVVVDAGPQALLPSWAHFCHVVLDAGRLPLTLERDALAAGPGLDEVRDRLGREILAELILLEAYEPERFHRLTRAYGHALASAAREHRGDLSAIRSTLPVPTTVGVRTVEDFRHVPGVVACAGPETWPVIGPTAAREGVLVVDARDPGVLRLLETLGTDGPRLELLNAADLVRFGVASA